MMYEEPENPTNDPPGEGRTRYQMVGQIVDLFWSKAVAKEASVSDFIRLVGLEREFDAEQPVKEVRVTWVPLRVTECLK